jgi:hypothetical protein
MRSDLERIEETLLESLEQLLELSDKATPEELVDIAQLLWNLNNGAEKALSPLKEKLRTLGALSVNYQPGRVVLQGAYGGEAVVTIPKTRLVLKPEADVASLKEILGDIFDRVFTQKTTYQLSVKDAERELSSGSGSKKQSLIKVLDQNRANLRISFSKN